MKDYIKANRNTSRNAEVESHVQPVCHKNIQIQKGS